MFNWLSGSDTDDKRAKFLSEPNINNLSALRSQDVNKLVLREVLAREIFDRNGTTFDQSWS
jgi:hypothetical protein